MLSDGKICQIVLHFVSIVETHQYNAPITKGQRVSPGAIEARVDAALRAEIDAEHKQAGNVKRQSMKLCRSSVSSADKRAKNHETFLHVDRLSARRRRELVAHDGDARLHHRQRVLHRVARERRRHFRRLVKAKRKSTRRPLTHCASFVPFAVVNHQQSFATEQRRHCFVLVARAIKLEPARRRRRNVLDQLGLADDDELHLGKSQSGQTSDQIRTKL